jgi:hypothetical protein
MATTLLTCQTFVDTSCEGEMQGPAEIQIERAGLPITQAMAGILLEAIKPTSSGTTTT